jgi:ParB-like chromosome segregation protein Spo0J
MLENIASEPHDNHWLEVIGRSLAYMCPHSANMAERSLAEKAALLEALGVSRTESARMLGTSYNSLTELMRLARNKKKRGGKHANGRKTKTH